jgi:hypothetical protein
MSPLTVHPTDVDQRKPDIRINKLVVAMHKTRARVEMNQQADAWINEALKSSRKISYGYLAS